MKSFYINNDYVNQKVISEMDRALDLFNTAINLCSSKINVDGLSFSEKEYVKNISYNLKSYKNSCSKANDWLKKSTFMYKDFIDTSVSVINSRTIPDIKLKDYTINK